MKKILMLFLALHTFAETILAENVKIGDLYYNLNTTDKTAEVISDNYNGLESVVIPSIIVYDEQEFSVTSIGDEAFRYCDALKSIEIPNSVVRIGKIAFHGCDSLKSVNISDLTAWCSINFDGAASNPLYKSEAILYIEGSEIKDLVIPYGIINICNYAFCGYSGLTQVTIPNSVTSIGRFTFFVCDKLTSIVIPDSVTSIGYRAFERSRLESLVIGQSVSFIDEKAFRDCIYIKEITCRSSVPSTCGASVFEGVDKSIPLYVPEESVSVYKAANQWNEFANIWTIGSTNNPILNENLYYYVNPNTLTAKVTSNPNGTYKGDITIPTSIKYQKVNFNVTSIGEGTFSGCSELKKIEINRIENIEDKAFYNCNGLASITCNATTPPTCGDNVFYGVNKSIPLYVPATRISEYKSANVWKDFTNIKPLITIDNPVQIGGLYYYLEAEDYTAEVVSNPNGSKYSGSITIPSSVTYQNVNFKVIGIGSDAFSQCSGLTSITMPKSIETIGERAFYQCTGLTSITIPSNVESLMFWAFAFCSNLTSITCEAVEPPFCGSGVFADVNKSTPLLVPTGSISAYKEADQWKEFTKIQAIGSIDNPVQIGELYYNLDADTKTAEVTHMPSGKYTMANITIPSSVVYKSESFAVKSIGRMAFHSCTEVKEVTIPNSVTYIGEMAFFYCTGLTSMTIPNSVTTIDKTAFSTCFHITSLTIGRGVTQLGKKAFSGCTRLASITCEASTPPACDELVFEEINKSIPVYVPVTALTAYKSADQWSDFTNIWAIGAPDSDAHIQIGDLYYKFNNDDFTAEVTYKSYNATSQKYNEGWSISNANIPASLEYNGLSYTVTSIGENAFENCTGLINVTIPNTVTSIEWAAFYHCYSLTNVTIPNSVISIGNWAFHWCDGLTKITLSDNLTSIGSNTFSGCSRLPAITLPASLTSIGEEAFDECTGLKSISCLAVTPPYCGEKVFNNVDKSIPLYVPTASISVYTTTYQWRDFTNIQSIEFGVEEVLNEQSHNSSKILRDGHILILRGEKVYTVTGQEVQ